MNKINPKTKYAICMVSVFFTIIATVVLCCIPSYADVSKWIRAVVAVLAVLLVISNLTLVTVVVAETESFECCHCGKRFVPTLKEYIMGIHTPRKRYLKCPHCHKKGWNKAYLSEN